MRWLQLFLENLGQTGKFDFSGRSGGGNIKLKELNYGTKKSIKFQLLFCLVWVTLKLLTYHRISTDAAAATTKEATAAEYTSTYSAAATGSEYLYSSSLKV